MDSHKGNKIHPDMSNAITKIITNKVLRYDLNILTNVNIHEECEDSVALKDETSFEICDDVPPIITKKKRGSLRKKSKRNKENADNDAIVQDTPKIPKKCLKKSSISAAKDKIVKRAIKFKTPQSPDRILTISRDMCQKQLENLRKQNLSELVLSQDEINKLIMKYKSDGHFQMRSNNHPSNSLKDGKNATDQSFDVYNTSNSDDLHCAQDKNLEFNDINRYTETKQLFEVDDAFQVKSSNYPSNYIEKGKGLTNEYCEAYKTHNICDQHYVQNKNIEFNEINTYALAPTNSDASQCVDYKDKNLYYKSHSVIENLHFSEQTMLPPSNQGNYEDNRVYPTSFHNNLLQNGNMFNTTATESTYLDINASHYDYGGSNMQTSSSNASHINIEVPQYKNSNEFLINHYNTHQMPPLPNMALGTEHGTHRNVNLSSTPESVQTSINTNFMAPSMILHSNLMGAHNVPSLTENVETAFNNMAAEHKCMNELHNGSNSYSRSKEITNMHPCIEASSTYQLPLLNNGNFEYVMGNNYNNNIGIDCNISNVSWQQNNNL